ncbi:NAD kinase [Tessaracoccus sp. OH4464_COT-324]|uniref:NAD kinase n=1 Tax=Tessaracoccus sp. OH4464_COT-324 TaxID=2491059 RepID=UPI000F635058|nr:NAD kinase [Tessaracoccus sp. OH4464_COT-324]RRD47685.1 NAD kinase [Tessaracoccus sp. OH4464_COT-324]
MERTVAVFLHPEKAEATEGAAAFISALSDFGFCAVLRSEDRQRLEGRVDKDLGLLNEHSRAELGIVFGGDGTILRAAAWALPLDVPILGVNLGHVGFLAELEPSDIAALPEAVAQRRYTVEERLVLDVLVHRDGSEQWRVPAINEVSLEKLARERMLTVLVSIDGRPVSRWACDGVLVSTPTGSTAYGFSAGGPVIWPDVQAMLVVPLSAHALFNRPLVLSPSSRVELQQPIEGPHGVLWCDGRVSYELTSGDEVVVTANQHKLRIARLSEQPFSTRLVKKFALPVSGWRRGEQC